MTNQAFEPKNEQGAIVIFAQQCIGTEWSIVEIRTQYPDAILEYKGELWNAEFEFRSSHFKHHRHDPRKCDIIVCWEHDYEDCILPVICLSNEEWKTTTFHRHDPKDLEIEHWKSKFLKIQRKLMIIESGMTEDDFPEVVKPSTLVYQPEVVEVEPEPISTNFRLPSNTMPDESQRKKLYEEWRRLGSKNKTVKSVFGNKSPKYMEWVSMAIAENHVAEENHLTN